MKEMLQLSRFLVLLLSVSVTSLGQYTGSYPNVAVFKTASASATAPGQGPELAVDSSVATYCSVTGSAPAWIMVDLGAMHNIFGFGMILPNAGELPLAMTIQASQDGTDWMDIRNISVDAAGVYTYNVVGLVPVQYFRYRIIAKDARASFAEIMLYGDEWSPPGSPLALEATDIETTSFMANWTEKNRAEGYTLTVATDIDFTDRLDGYNNLDVGEANSWQVAGLTINSTYYYVVKAYNIAGSSNSSNIIEVTTAKVPQTISFEPLAGKTYGDLEFELVATSSSGLAVSFSSSADSVASISGTTVSIVGAGTVSITAIQEGDATYDAATPVSRELVVSAKELTVTGAKAENKVYDGTLKAVVSGAILNGTVEADDISLANGDLGVFAQSGVGTAIEVSTSMTLDGSDSPNYYLIGPVGLAADILEKELVVTAGDYSREACEANPELNVIDISGFVNGEDESVMTESPLAETAADKNSPPGDYEVLVSGGAAPNYVLTHVNGTLTITPDVTKPTLTVQAIVIELNENGNASISSSDLVVSADDNCAISDTVLSQNTFTTEDIGNVNVQVTVTDATGNSASKLATVTVNGPNGIGEWSEIEAIVYPNPTDGELELIIESPVDMLRLIDMTGKNVLRKTHIYANETLDLSEFSNGIYVLQLQSGQVTKHIKIIKK